MSAFEFSFTFYGLVLGLAVVSTVVILTLGTASSSDGAASTAVDALKAALGLLLVVLAARKWRSRPRPGDEPELPKWLATVDALTPPKALALGATLSGINPKNLALTVAAAASIAQSGLGPGDEVLAIVVFVVLGSVTVAGAVIAAMVAPRRTAAPLASIQSFMSTNNAVIMMVILLVFGAKLLGEGIGGLTA